MSQLLEDLIIAEKTAALRKFDKLREEFGIACVECNEKRWTKLREDLRDIFWKSMFLEQQLREKYKEEL